MFPLSSVNLTPSALSRGLIASLFLRQITKNKYNFFLHYFSHISIQSRIYPLPQFLTDLSHSLTLICPLLYAFRDHCWLCIEHPFSPSFFLEGFLFGWIIPSSPCTHPIHTAMCLFFNLIFKLAYNWLVYVCVCSVLQILADM